jgi:hypothetical protein
MAVSYGLHTSEKAESQEFIGGTVHCYFILKISCSGAELLTRLLRAKTKEKIYGQE